MGGWQYWGVGDLRRQRCDKFWMFWFLFLGCCATAQKWERVRCAVSNKQERTNNGQDWAENQRFDNFPQSRYLVGLYHGQGFLSFAFDAMSYSSELTIARDFVGRNLDLSYNYDYAFMIDHKCKVLFCSIFHSDLFLRSYGQGSKSRNFPIGYIYFQYGTCISSRVHVFPKGYIYFH